MKSKAVLQGRTAERVKNMTVSFKDITITREVAQFLAQPHKLLIDGEWVAAASGHAFPVYNPATGEIIAQVAEGDTEDIDRAVRAARRAFDGGPWRTMTPS